MTVYAIREKGTDKYLPNGIFSKGRLRPKGFSHTESSNTLFIRLFPTEKSARNSLVMWLQGKWKGNYNSIKDEIYLDFDSVPERKRENMEIVKFRLVEIKK